MLGITGGWLEALRKEEFRRVEHLHQSRVLHLKDPNLIGRSKTVLGGPQYAEGMISLSLYVENCIHHMFQHFWPCNKTFLRHMTNEKDRDRKMLRQIEQPT
jgi:hypothetical protein